MRHPHAFLFILSAAIAVFCGAGAYSLRPQTDGSGTAAGFLFFSTMAGAGAALTLATGADAITARER